MDDWRLAGCSTPLCLLPSSYPPIYTVAATPIPISPHPQGRPCPGTQSIMKCAIAVISVLFLNVHGQVTVYKQQPLGPATTAASSAPAADYTGAAAYNPTILNPPPIPDPLPPMAFGIQLQQGGTPGVSIAQTGAFFGFSVEMSVVNQACRSPFLLALFCLAERTSSRQKFDVHRRTLPQPYGEYTTACWQRQDTRRRKHSGDCKIRRHASRWQNDQQRH